MNYNFNDFQSSGGTQLLHPHARDQLDIPMTGTDAPMLLSPAVSAMQHQMPAMTSAAQFQTIPASMMPPPTPSEAAVDSIDAQIQFLQQQKLRHQQRQLEEQQLAFFTRQQNRMVPPTPRSLELQPATNQFFPQSSASDQQQQALEYRYQRLKDQADMSFTPLVSPAVTPLDTHFAVDSHFGVSSAYFSPLTSPALHAQTDPLAMFDHIHSVVTTSSPVDMDMDSSNLPAIPNLTPGDLAKKMRKNAAKARAKSGIKQSPISKPLRRRTATTPSMNAQMLSELAESAEHNQDSHLLPRPMLQTSSSSTTGVTDSEDSVSPEALNDMTHIEMPPPPIPKPRIKPLLPGGPDAEEAASHLLATKSNYQRILEGNTLPGVSYPSELSTNLTSKRTSHKIAEQGRRNRINSALQEIATLLPRSVMKESEGERKEKEKEKEKNAAAGGLIARRLRVQRDINTISTQPAAYDEDLHDITSAAAAAEAEILESGAGSSHKSTQTQAKPPAQQSRATQTHTTGAQGKQAHTQTEGGYDEDLHDVTAAAEAAEREILEGRGEGLSGFE
ncbi:hypothetical protein N0V88_004539 [Collariella sp. IMI 366227]|nr:hypothetical protein N0V88_004539 [Collariella sp. IMI 366227]